MTRAGRFQRNFYRGCKLACAFVQVQCVRLHVLDRPAGTLDGGYQLAVTHLSHLEPIVVSLLVRRHVRWMSRIEFFRNRVVGTIFRAGGVFAVNRQGVSVSAIRTAIAEIDSGGVVGIFPEGGVKKRGEAAVRGGRIKRGVCLIAQRTGRPVVPVVVLGTEHLNQVKPYLPFRRGRVWVAFGEPLHPPPPNRTASRRADRAAMAATLTAAYQDLYARLLREYELRDADVP